MVVNSPIIDIKDRRSTHSHRSLDECRVIGLLNSTELFGHERGNIEVFKALRAMGAKVVIGVNSLDSGGEVHQHLKQLEFDTFFLPFGCQWSKQFFRRFPSQLPKNVWKIYQCSRILRSQINRLQATHLHLGNPLVYSFIAPELWRNSQLDVIYRMGDEPPFTSGPNLRIWKACFRRANRVVTNSKFVHDSIQSIMRDAKPVELVYNVSPHTPSTIAFEDTRGEALPSVSKFLYVGQISEHKGVSLLIDSALELCRKHSTCIFDVVGGSQYSVQFEAELRTRIQNAGLSGQILMHGQVADPRPFYQQASALIVPSIFEEPAANVVLEAKCHGVPSIVFPSGGLPELVTDGHTGWVCETKSQSALIERLEHCVARPDECRMMSASCLSEMETKFGFDRFVNQWSAIYQAHRYSSPKLCR